MCILMCLAFYFSCRTDCMAFGFHSTKCQISPLVGDCGSKDTFSHTEYLTQSSEYHSLLSSSSGQSSPPDLWKQLISSSSAVPQPSIESASTQQGFLSHQCFWPHMRKHDSGGEERREKWVSGSPASFCINYGTLPGLLQMYNPNRFSGAPSEAIISEYV